MSQKKDPIIRLLIAKNSHSLMCALYITIICAEIFLLPQGYNMIHIMAAIGLINAFYCIKIAYLFLPMINGYAFLQHGAILADIAQLLAIFVTFRLHYQGKIEIIWLAGLLSGITVYGIQNYFSQIFTETMSDQTNGIFCYIIYISIIYEYFSYKMQNTIETNNAMCSMVAHDALSPIASAISTTEVLQHMLHKNAQPDTVLQSKDHAFFLDLVHQLHNTMQHYCNTIRNIVYFCRNRELILYPEKIIIQEVVLELQKLSLDPKENYTIKQSDAEYLIGPAPLLANIIHNIIGSLTHDVQNINIIVNLEYGKISIIIDNLEYHKVKNIDFNRINYLNKKDVAICIAVMMAKNLGYHVKITGDDCRTIIVLQHRGL